MCKSTCLGEYIGVCCHREVDAWTTDQRQAARRAIKAGSPDVSPNICRYSGVEKRLSSCESLLQLYGSWIVSSDRCRRQAHVSHSGLFPLPIFRIVVDGKQGQVLLVENPREPLVRQYELEGQVKLDRTFLNRMFFRSPQRVHKDATYVFPRLPGGGVILGGCRLDNSWDGKVDLKFAEDIKRRCCTLVPELGRPEDLKVIQHGVGLRRKIFLSRRIQEN